MGSYSCAKTTSNFSEILSSTPSFPSYCSLTFYTTHLLAKNTFFIHNVSGHIKVTSMPKKSSFYSSQWVRLVVFVPIFIFCASKGEYFWQVGICQLFVSADRLSISAWSWPGCAGWDAFAAQPYSFVILQLQGLASGAVSYLRGQMLKYFGMHHVFPKAVGKIWWEENSAAGLATSTTAPAPALGQLIVVQSLVPG